MFAVERRATRGILASIVSHIHVVDPHDHRFPRAEKLFWNWVLPNVCSGGSVRRGRFLVSSLRQLVDDTASKFEPALLSAFTAERAVAEWAAIERVACAATLRSAARAEEVGLDAEQAVAAASGITSGQARKQTRVRRKLSGKQRTAEALDKGDLSPTQADAIADAEQTLLNVVDGGASASALLSECERIKRDAADADGSLAARQRAARSLRSWTDAMGMTCLSGRLEPLVGAKIIAELEKRSDRMFRAQVRVKGVVDAPEQRMADALAELFASGGSAGATRRGPRTVVQLLVTKAAAERGHVKPGEKCETAAGRPIPMAAVDEAFMGADTKVQEVVFDEVDVTSIITHKRYVPARPRDALSARGLCCAVPGCGRTKGLQKDHEQDFAKGGPTSLANLRWLCHYHHDLKTRGRYRLYRNDAGEMRWEPIVRS